MLNEASEKQDQSHIWRSVQDITRETLLYIVDLAIMMMPIDNDVTLTAQQAAEAQTALRRALGLEPENFPVQALSA